MKIIANHSEGQALKKDGIVLSTIAKKAKRLDSSVIDGTLGTFYFEDGKFRTHSFVKDILFSLKDDEIFSYATSQGSEEFQNASIKWLFGKNTSVMLEKMNIKAIATPGGTGAITASIYESLDAGQFALIPTPCWGPYEGIVTSRGFNCLKFNLFDNKKFSLNDFFTKCDELIKIQKKVVFILNDPCNNPTGYSLTDDELKEIINYMNRNEEIPFVMIYDCAYIDMSSQGMEKTRDKLKIFSEANDNVVICCTVSYSKTFFIYGQRLGAQVIISKNKEAVDDFFKYSLFYARHTWSNCNKGIISLVQNIVDNENYLNIFRENVGGIVNDLKIRSNLFITEANEVGLELYPYDSGFFIAIPCINIESVLNELANKFKIYLLPFDGCIRVAICSIPTKDIKGLARKIKLIFDEFE